MRGDLPRRVSLVVMHATEREEKRDARDFRADKLPGVPRHFRFGQTRDRRIGNLEDFIGSVGEAAEAGTEDHGNGRPERGEFRRQSAEFAGRGKRSGHRSRLRSP